MDSSIFSSSLATDSTSAGASITSCDFRSSANWAFSAVKGNFNNSSSVGFVPGVNSIMSFIGFNLTLLIGDNCSFTAGAFTAGAFTAGAFTAGAFTSGCGRFCSNDLFNSANSFSSSSSSPLTASGKSSSFSNWRNSSLSSTLCGSILEFNVSSASASACC